MSILKFFLWLTDGIFFGTGHKPNVMSLLKITTVEELVDKLMNKEPTEDFLEILKAIDIDQRDFERYYKWSDDHYTRNCLCRTDEFELMLVCWEKGQESPIHDFLSHAAWIHVVQGKLKEEDFRISKRNSHLEKVGQVTLNSLDYSYLSRRVGIHRFINTYESRTISLHLHAAPLTKWREFDRNTGETKEREASYDCVYKMGAGGPVECY